DQAGHGEADAAELFGVVAIDHEALVDVRELRVVAVEIVVVKARHGLLLFAAVRELGAARLRVDELDGAQLVRVLGSGQVGLGRGRAALFHAAGRVLDAGELHRVAAGAEDVLDALHVVLAREERADALDLDDALGALYRVSNRAHRELHRLLRGGAEARIRLALGAPCARGRAGVHAGSGVALLEHRAARLGIHDLDEAAKRVALGLGVRAGGGDRLALLG